MLRNFVEKIVKNVAMHQCKKSPIYQGLEDIYESETDNIEKIKELSSALDDMEERLMEKCHFLLTVMDLMPYPIFYKSKDGTYTAVNDAFAQLAGVPRSDVIGKRINELFTDDVSALSDKEDTVVMRTMLTQEYLLETRKPGGKLHVMIVTKMPYIDKDGIFQGIIGIFCDITSMAERISASGRYKVLEYSVRRNGKVPDVEKTVKMYGGARQDTTDEDEVATNFFGEAVDPRIV